MSGVVFGCLCEVLQADLVPVGASVLCAFAQRHVQVLPTGVLIYASIPVNVLCKGSATPLRTPP